jgi:acetylglutamate/LysW-gamma-L-alpha-aminoadipate kinase
MMIIKIGGGKGINIAGIARDLAGLGGKCIVVHGANAFRNKFGKKLGIIPASVTSLSGYSSVLSTESAIDLQMMVYAGLRNKRIVEFFQKEGVKAVGICGLDARCIEGRRNKGIKVNKGGKKLLLRDFSGKPARINREFFDLLLDNDYVPVLTVPIADEQGIANNSENDEIVALLCREFKAGKVFQLIEAKGFLKEKDNPGSLIRLMNRMELQNWEGKAEGRMKRKLHALNKMGSISSCRIFISDGRVDNPVRQALAGAGTLIEF